MYLTEHEQRNLDDEIRNLQATLKHVRTSRRGAYQLRHFDFMSEWANALEALRKTNTFATADDVSDEFATWLRARYAHRPELVREIALQGVYVRLDEPAALPATATAAPATIAPTPAAVVPPPAPSPVGSSAAPSGSPFLLIPAPSGPSPEPKPASPTKAHRRTRSKGHASGRHAHTR